MLSGKIEENILFEDKDILVCRKISGIAVQNAGIGTMDMESALKNYLAVKQTSSGNIGQKDKVPYLAVVHRLDQPVEGVLVFAKTPRAAKELSRQITQGKMEKNYLAVTFGMPPVGKNEERVLEDYLKKDGKTNTSFATAPGTPGSKKARLWYKVLETIEDPQEGKEKHLLQIRLETGRHHQIRVQLSHAGMPLAGDRKYGALEKTKFSLGLCAWQLTFTHPVTGKKMKFETIPVGDAFQGFSLNKS